MESTGQRGKIQISQATADYLIQAGKTNWITPRQDKVVAKGKGEMQTFWVLFERPKTEMTDVTETSMRGSCDDNLFEVAPFLSSQDPQAVAKQERLVKWNVEVLSNLLRQIQTRRTLVSSSTHGTASDNWNEIALGSDKTVLDEVQEIINIPKFKGEPPVKPDSIKLSRILRNELKDYVSTVAAMYNENPFHNFGMSWVFSPSRENMILPSCCFSQKFALFTMSSFLQNMHRTWYVSRSFITGNRHVIIPDCFSDPSLFLSRLRVLLNCSVES